MKLFFLPLLLCSFLVGCASVPQAASPDTFWRIAGKHIYGMVVVSNDIPEDAVLKSDACLKRDAACMLALQQVRQQQFATVAIYDTVAFAKVLVPKGLSLQSGDIIQLYVNPDATRPPVFTAMGTRAAQRNASCDWIDGSASSRKGGISCYGWTYKELL
ncbi:MAG: hypothetical protein ACT6Q9_02060 [Polaromonas sp.]|uniref:hypothetical protein n=1 Tax=Polaromonas sp. TaxID=1869339 RepID=UPI0040370A0D